MSSTNCKICISSTNRAKSPEVEFYQDIEDKHIIDIGTSRAGRIVGSTYITGQLIPYIKMAYDTEKYKYLSVAVPDIREVANHPYYAEMFRTIQ